MWRPLITLQLVLVLFCFQQNAFATETGDLGVGALRASTSEGFRDCTGFKISAHQIMTADHCVSGISAQNIFLTLSISGQLQTYFASDKASLLEKGLDIAILTFNEDLSNDGAFTLIQPPQLSLDASVSIQPTNSPKVNCTLGSGLSNLDQGFSQGAWGTLLYFKNCSAPLQAGNSGAPVFVTHPVTQERLLIAVYYGLKTISLSEETYAFPAATLPFPEFEERNTLEELTQILTQQALESETARIQNQNFVRVNLTTGSLNETWVLVALPHCLNERSGQHRLTVLFPRFQMERTDTTNNLTLTARAERTEMDFYFQINHSTASEREVQIYFGTQINSLLSVQLSACTP